MVCGVALFVVVGYVWAVCVFVGCVVVCCMCVYAVVVCVVVVWCVYVCVLRGVSWVSRVVPRVVCFLVF